MREYPVDIQYEYRGKNVKWFSMDDESFAKYAREIEYRFNSHGFRMDIEMVDVKKNQPLYIGDSTTMGFGVNIEDTWAYKHFNKYGGEQFVNLAVTSGSIDTTSRILDYWVPVLEPSKIFFLQNAGNRQEFIGQDGLATVIGVWKSIDIQQQYGYTIDDEALFLSKIFDRYVSPEINILVNFNKNMNAIKWITKNIKFHFCKHSPWDKRYFGGSRDGFHSGPEQHDKLLQWFEDNEEIF